MRIAHVSDLHIRNFKYRAEYRAAFQDLYEQLRHLKPDLIVNTGDTVHSKLAVSPELYEELTDHMLEMTEIAPYWITLGNHDLNLRNKSRTDTISPIVRALQIPGRTKNDLRLLCSGRHWMPSTEFDQFRFWNYDIRGHGEFNPLPEYINVGLYHGSILGCVTDLGFVMTDAEADLEQFKGMDFMMLGDIHKRQAFMGGRAWYAGSLIQQNYGEEGNKGFLLWNISSKTDFNVEYHRVHAPGRFFTIQVPASLEVGDIRIPKKSRIKALVQGELTPSRRMELERRIRERFDPLEVITPDPSADKRRLDELTIERLVGSRERMMRDHLEDLGCSSAQIDQVLQLWNNYLVQIEDAAARGTTWSLKRFGWDSFMNYGEGNSLELKNLKGLVGVFAPNASGKSTIFDVLLEGLFDKISKDAPKNIDLINDNRDKARIEVEFESNGQPYTIEREIERITYGQRKLAETKQWGKMSLNFMNDGDSLNGDSRPETERSIRAIIGSFEDFTLTTMVTQNPNFGLPGGGDIINCKETDRRKILFRFLDLDVYEKVHHLCRDELKGILGGLKESNRESLLQRIDENDQELSQKRSALAVKRSELLELERTKAEVEVTLNSIDGHDVDVQTLENAARQAGKRFRDSSRKLEEMSDKLYKLSVYALRLTDAPSDRPHIPLNQLVDEMARVRSEKENARLKLSKERDRYDRGKKSLKTLEDVPCEGKFPTCKFISDASRFATEREVVEQAIKNHVAMIESTTGQLLELEQYEVRHRELDQRAQELAQINVEIERFKGKLALLEKELEENRELKVQADLALEEARQKIVAMSEIISLREQISDLEGLISAKQKEIEVLLINIGSLIGTHDGLDRELQKLDEVQGRVQVYELLSEMTGKTGLPLRILSLVLPVINAEIAKILGGVTKFNAFFEHSPEDQTVSLYIRYGDYKSRPLSLGSGAEKFIASLAIRVALLSVSSLPKTDILIVDEGFGKLDPEYLEALQRMFEYLKEAFGTVFLVSHVDSMRDMVDHSLDITSLDGYAHVEA